MGNKLLFLIILLFSFQSAAAQSNNDSNLSSQILNIINNFDTSTNFRCGFEFGMGKKSIELQNTNGLQTVYEKVTKEQIFELLKQYNIFCQERSYGEKLDKQLLEKINKAIDEEVYNLILGFKTSGNKVIELYYFIYNKNTFLELSYYQILSIKK